MSDEQPIPESVLAMACEKLRAAFPEWIAMINRLPPRFDEEASPYIVRIYMEHKAKSGRTRASHGFSIQISAYLLADHVFPLEDYVRKTLEHGIRQWRFRKRKRKAETRHSKGRVES